MAKGVNGGARAAPSKIGTAVLVLLLVVLLAAAGCGIWYAIATNGFTRFITLEYNGKELAQNARQVVLNHGENEFGIRNMNPFSGELTYTVEINPNAEENFNFTVDENPAAFSRVGELTKYFGIEQGEDAFTVTVPQDYTMEWLLPQVYAGSEVEMPEEFEKDKDYFEMTVEFSDGTDIMLLFNVSDKVSSIEIDPPSIIF